MQSILKALAVAVLAVAPQAAQAARCSDYSTCEQAVRNWCAGNHPGADRDDDGIPCESVCGSKAQVDEIRSRIGCRFR